MIRGNAPGLIVFALYFLGTLILFLKISRWPRKTLETIVSIMILAGFLLMASEFRMLASIFLGFLSGGAIGIWADERARKAAQRTAR